LCFHLPDFLCSHAYFGKTPYLPLSTKEIRFGEVDDLVSATVDDGADHIKAESQRLFRTDRGRHREFLPAHDHLNQSRSVMCDGAFERGSQILRPFHTDAKYVISIAPGGYIADQLTYVLCPALLRLQDMEIVEHCSEQLIFAAKRTCKADNMTLLLQLQ
jgi:hypothetical protein